MEGESDCNPESVEENGGRGMEEARTCVICRSTFDNSSKLRYHIARKHLQRNLAHELVMIFPGVDNCDICNESIETESEKKKRDNEPCMD